MQQALFNPALGTGWNFCTLGSRVNCRVDRKLDKVKGVRLCVSAHMGKRLCCEVNKTETMSMDNCC